MLSSKLAKIAFFTGVLVCFLCAMVTVSLFCSIRYLDSCSSSIRIGQTKASVEDQLAFFVTGRASSLSRIPSMYVDALGPYEKSFTAEVKEYAILGLNGSLSFCVLYDKKERVVCTIQIFE